MSTTNGVLSSDGLCLEKKSSNNWDCATRGSTGWSEGKHESGVKVRVILENLYNQPISKISDQETDKKNEREQSRREDYIAFVDLNNDEHKCLGRAVKKGETVNICLDMDMGTITFGLNGKMNQMPSKSDLKGTWYPYVCMFSKGAKISVTP